MDFTTIHYLGLKYFKKCVAIISASHVATLVYTVDHVAPRWRISCKANHITFFDGPNLKRRSNYDYDYVSDALAAFVE